MRTKIDTLIGWFHSRPDILEGTMNYKVPAKNKEIVVCTKSTIFVISK